MSHKKFGPDQFSRFDVYWIQTDRQTDRQTNRQTSQIYIKIRKNVNVQEYTEIRRNVNV